MELLKNYINGSWAKSKENNTIDVINPATQEVMGKVPYGTRTSEDFNQAVDVAEEAFKSWSQEPVMKRVQPLYKLKSLMEENLEDLARTITIECGKTLAESRGELQRAIENVEVACGMPVMMQSEFSENIAGGIDEFMIRQPLGVCGCIAPFNFPGMIPFWFLPYAIAAGNSFILKPSEKVPLTMIKVFQLIDQLDLPKGVIQLVLGGKETVDAMLDHPEIKAISFVGSTNVARYVYSRGTANGKRVQAQGGAKNPIVVLPDADIEMSTQIITDSTFGCAGQRCLAASNIITVGDQSGSIKESLYESAKNRKTGYGLDENIEMGPVINGASKNRISSLIDKGVNEGGKLLLDGRNTHISGFEKGNFIQPTIIENLPLDGEILKTEIFGPVMSLIQLDSIDEALQLVNNGAYGNMACIFTSSGANARKIP